MQETTTQHAFEDELFFTLRQQRDNWARIAVGSVLASILALLTLIFILPLNETRPYVVLVDKTTGDAEKVVEVRPASIDQQDAVLQAELVSYVSDRETYDPADNPTRIPDVMARSAENAAETLANIWNAGSPDYPPKVYGTGARVRVVVKSISLTPSTRKGGPDLAQVRLVKFREERGQETATRSFVATVGYRFEPQKAATLEAVWKNPLGFTVLSYRIDAETMD